MLIMRCGGVMVSALNLGSAWLNVTFVCVLYIVLLSNNFSFLFW